MVVICLTHVGRPHLPLSMRTRHKALMYRSNSDGSVESAKSSDEDQEALCQLSKGLATTMQKFGENAAKLRVQLTAMSRFSFF